MPLHIGMALLTVLAAMMVSVSIDFWCGGWIEAWIFPCSVGVGLLFLGCLERKVGPCLWLLAIIGLCLGAGWLFSDMSADGNTYHQEIIVYLLEGWNYFASQPPSGDASLWSAHYAKLPEVMAACICKCMDGDIEWGKAFNFMLFALTGLIAWWWLRQQLNRRQGLWCLLLVLANPIVIGQLPTYYVDFCSYCYLVVTLVGLLALGSFGGYHKIACYVLLCITLMAIGTKFTAFFYQGVTLILAMFWWAWHRQWYKACIIACTGLGSLVVGLYVLFYHPYITNYIGHGHILYPLMGESTVDIMDINTPEMYQGHNRVVNFLLNLIAPYLHPKYFLISYEYRIGGFGGTMLLLLIVSAIAYFRNIRRWPRVCGYLLCMVILSCFIFSQS